MVIVTAGGYGWLAGLLNPSGILKCDLKFHKNVLNVANVS
jgi:hypothetical protein